MDVETQATHLKLGLKAENPAIFMNNVVLSTDWEMGER